MGSQLVLAVGILLHQQVVVVGGIFVLAVAEIGVAQGQQTDRGQGPGGIVQPHPLVGLNGVAEGIEHGATIVGHVGRDGPRRVGIVQLLPINAHGKLAADHKVEVPRVGVLLQQSAIGVVGLGILVGEEFALALQEQRVFLQGRVGPTVGRRGKLGRRLLVLLIAEQGLALLHGRPGDLLIGAVADRRLDVLVNVFRRQVRPFEPVLLFIFLPGVGDADGARRRRRKLGGNRRRRTGRRVLQQAGRRIRGRGRRAHPRRPGARRPGNQRSGSIGRSRRRIGGGCHARSGGAGSARGRRGRAGRRARGIRGGAGRRLGRRLLTGQRLVQPSLVFVALGRGMIGGARRSRRDTGAAAEDAQGAGQQQPKSPSLTRHTGHPCPSKLGRGAASD